MATFTSLSFGGKMLEGLAETLRITGGVVSCTFTVVDCVTGAELPSLTETTMVVVPSGNVPMKVAVPLVVGCPAAIVSVSTTWLLISHWTLRLSPSASVAATVMSASAPLGEVHSRVCGAVKCVICGGWFDGAQVL